MCHIYVCIAPAEGGKKKGNENETGKGNEDVGNALNKGDDNILGMTAPKIKRLRLENTYDNQSCSQDMFGHDHAAPPCSIQKEVKDSEASAVNTGSMSCSESSNRTENHV